MYLKAKTGSSPSATSQTAATVCQSASVNSGPLKGASYLFVFSKGRE